MTNIRAAQHPRRVAQRLIEVSADQYVVAGEELPGHRQRSVGELDPPTPHTNAVVALATGWRGLFATSSPAFRRLSVTASHSDMSAHLSSSSSVSGRTATTCIPASRLLDLALVCALRQDDAGRHGIRTPRHGIVATRQSPASLPSARVFRPPRPRGRQTRAAP